MRVSSGLAATVDMKHGVGDGNTEPREMGAMGVTLIPTHETIPAHPIGFPRPGSAIHVTAVLSSPQSMQFTSR